ncbi:PP2C family protein-serine/threonine phosphatase [Amycolatopsis thailandensis]|uniref:Protein phosphatase n=1 Tax=Amycolatopsis thailandensis TaxID=589330 RepID=A0A229RMV5_9PSEU|nr:protein phosphatase 2C domain-containing protein [Amycolatopsis thailandensis]OXM47744.1 protein phosphatase [Amycolatopsis thailandensis]
MRYTLRYAAGSDIGQRRQVNQDSVYASARMLAVADGIGGQPHGEVASAEAVGVLSRLDSDLGGFDLADVDLFEVLNGGLRAIDDRLAATAEEQPETRGMGTTLTALLFDGAQFTAVHIGDSKGYLLRDGTLQRFTRDHTLAQALADDGRIDPSEVEGHPRGSLLMKALLSTGSGEADIWTFEAAPGDRLLLCSDGLTATVVETVIKDVLGAFQDPAETVPRLIDLANEGGGPDNITCVVADVLPPARA